MPPPPPPSGYHVPGRPLPPLQRHAVAEKRVIQACTALLILGGAECLRNVLRGNGLGALVALLVCLIPACGVFGARQRNRSLITTFWLCNALCACCYVIGLLLLVFVFLPAVTCMCDPDCRGGTTPEWDESSGSSGGVRYDSATPYPSEDGASFSTTDPYTPPSDPWGHHNSVDYSTAEQQFASWCDRVSFGSLYTSVLVSCVAAVIHVISGVFGKRLSDALLHVSFPSVPLERQGFSHVHPQVAHYPPRHVTYGQADVGGAGGGTMAVTHHHGQGFHPGYGHNPHQPHHAYQPHPSAQLLGLPFGQHHSGMQPSYLQQHGYHHHDQHQYQNQHHNQQYGTHGVSYGTPVVLPRPSRLVGFGNTSYDGRYATSAEAAMADIARAAASSLSVGPASPRSTHQDAAGTGFAATATAGRRSPPASAPTDPEDRSDAPWSGHPASGSPTTPNQARSSGLFSRLMPSGWSQNPAYEPVPTSCADLDPSPGAIGHRQFADLENASLFSSSPPSSSIYPEPPSSTAFHRDAAAADDSAFQGPATDFSAAVLRRGDSSSDGLAGNRGWSQHPQHRTVYPGQSIGYGMPVGGAGGGAGGGAVGAAVAPSRNRTSHPPNQIPPQTRTPWRGSSGAH